MSRLFLFIRNKKIFETKKIIRKKLFETKRLFEKIIQKNYSKQIIRYKLFETNYSKQEIMSWLFLFIRNKNRQEIKTRSSICCAVEPSLEVAYL
jgi:hypothetical protein